LISREDLLTGSYQQFRWALSHCGKGSINKRIQRKVRILDEILGLDRDDILHELFDNYLVKKHYRKFDPKRGRLSTFITHYTDKYLNHIIRKYNTLDNHRIDTIPEDYEDALDDNNRARHSLSFYEKRGLVDELIETRTPEDLFIAKELWEVIVKIVGLNDTLVLMGLKDRHEEAERKGMNYYSYCQRLHRKKLLLRSVLRELGYSV
jgi:hypothetical protein